MVELTPNQEKGLKIVPIPLIVLSYFLLLLGMSVNLTYYNYYMISGYTLLIIAILVIMAICYVYSEKNSLILNTGCLGLILVEIIGMILLIQKSNQNATLSTDYYTYVGWFNSILIFTTIASYITMTEKYIFTKTTAMLLLLSSTLMFINLGIIYTIVNDYTNDK
jgi:hypothetical protein